MIWKNDTYEDLSEYYYEETKRVSLIVTNGKRDDLTSDEIRKIIFSKFKGGEKLYEERCS